MAEPTDRGASAMRVVGAPGGSGGGDGDRAAKLKALNDKHSGMLAAIDLKFKDRIDTDQAELSVINQKWDQIQAEVDRQPRYARSWIYWPFMIVLMIFEVPVNRLSFELFFQESPTIALGVAFLVGMILVCLAHALGVMICRFGYFAKRRGWMGEAIKIALLTAMILFIVYGVSVLRQGYLDFETAPQATLSDLITGSSAVQTATDMFRSGLQISGWIFFAINLGIVAVGLTAAYLSHDPHPDFQEADIERKKLEKRLRAIKTQRSEAEATEMRRHTNQVHRLGF